MIPDVLIANYKLLNDMSEEDREVFEEAARLSTETELKDWETDVEAAKKTAEEDMGVQFLYPDISLFKDKVKNVKKCWKTIRISRICMSIFRNITNNTKGRENKWKHYIQSENG